MNRLAIGLVLMSFLAGCGSIGNLGSAADRLDRTTHRFYERVDTVPAASHAATDAEMLARAARDFNRAVDSSRSRDYLEPSFERVAERYHHLRRQLEDGTGSDDYLRADFDSVTEAYLDVDRALNHPDSRYHR